MTGAIALVLTNQFSNRIHWDHSKFHLAVTDSKVSPERVVAAMRLEKMAKNPSYRATFWAAL